ncbi:zinc ribbon domain-containing protein [Brevibacillus agri]
MVRSNFGRLQQFISCKANLVGIQVVEVNPAYTSQLFPVCGEKNKARDRKYECS